MPMVDPRSDSQLDARLDIAVIAPAAPGGRDTPLQDAPERGDPAGPHEDVRDGAPILECSVGIMAYNEAANVANAIASILGQPLARGHIAEVIVVASGCTDDTSPIV